MTNNEQSFKQLFQKTLATKKKSFTYEGVKVNLSKNPDQDVAWLKMRNALVKNEKEIFV